MTDISITSLTGDAISPYIDALAQLRLQVFHDWPYLYQGDMAYERHYLQKYIATRGTVVVIAAESGRPVGASTGLPLAAAEKELQAPFAAAGENVDEWYYFGESILLPAYRGRGIGVAFFTHRETQAHRLGYARTTFCSVQRPADHPMKPAGYMPLDAFWTKRGYTRRADIVAHFAWRDIGDADETSKPMTFWTKHDTASARPLP